MSEPLGTRRPVSRRDALRITAVAGISVAFGGGLAVGVLREAGVHRVSETRTRMGTIVTLTVVHPDPAAARKMIRASFAEMERLEGVFSRHRDDTPLGRLNATGELAGAPDELLSVLSQAEEFSVASHGAFDVTVAPLLELYERSFAQRSTPPSAAEVSDVLTLVDHRAVRVDGRRVTLDDPRMAITLDGIAKGYIVDRTTSVLVARGAERVMVNAGGDMATAGPGSADDPWTVGLQDPHSERDLVGLIRLGGECVATSGDYMRTFSDDRRHHHIVDPRTGRSPEESSSVSIVASSAMEADALSTTVLVLGPEAGATFLEAAHGIEGVIVSKDGTRFRSSGMGSHSA